jgi:hypothetical protein
MSSALGTVIASDKTIVLVSGLSATASLGAVTPLPTSVVNVTGQAMTSAVGSATAAANVTVAPNSLLAGISVGTPQVDLNADVNVTGLSMTASVSDSEAVYAWTEVDDSATMVWQEAA